MTASVQSEPLAPTWRFFTPADRIDVRGLDVAYRRAGNGEPVLYLHGFRMTRRWLPFYEELAAHCDLVVPEHPGFGDTPLPDWVDDMDDVVMHYAELTQKLDLETFHLVGYSYGGWLAAELAVYYPERLRSLTLIAPMGLRVPGHTPADVFRFSEEQYTDALFNGRGSDYQDYFCDGDAVDTTLQDYSERTAFARAAWNPRYDRKLDRRLGRVACPTVVIASEDDRIVPSAHAERYAELIPNASLEVLSGGDTPTGHGVVAQEPKRLADLVAAGVAANGRPHD